MVARIVPTNIFNCNKLEPIITGIIFLKNSFTFWVIFIDLVNGIIPHFKQVINNIKACKKPATNTLILNS